MARRNGSAELPLSAAARRSPPCQGTRPGIQRWLFPKKRPGERLDFMIVERLVKAAFKCTLCLMAKKELKKWGGKGNQPGH